MYGDFKITSTGDLAISESSYNNKLKISFGIFKNKPLRVGMAIIAKYYNQGIKEDTLRISIDINSNPVKYKVPSIKGDEFLEHIINLKINAIKGELENRKNFGSTIHMYELEHLNDDLLRRVETTLTKELEEYVNNVSVKAIYDNRSFPNGIKVVIKSGDIDITDYKIER